MALEMNTIMKFQASLLLALLLMPSSAFSQQYNVRDECYRNVEQYIPGYQTPDGRYVNGYVKTKRETIPCGNFQYGEYSEPQYTTQFVPRCDRNKTIFNGLLGGGIAASVSKQNAYAWSIPLGVALGISSSRIGCR